MQSHCRRWFPLHVIELRHEVEIVLKIVALPEVVKFELYNTSQYVQQR